MTNVPTVDARWAALDAMPREEWETIEARVSICLHCLGPAMLDDAEVEAIIAEPLCRRCRKLVPVMAE